MTAMIKRIIYAPALEPGTRGDYDAFLGPDDTHFIGSFPTEAQAEIALNAAADYLRRCPVPDPQDQAPITIDGPATLDSLSVAALEAAADRLRPDTTLTKALKRLKDGRWQRVVEEDGTVVLLVERTTPSKKGGTTTYRVTATACTCPGCTFRGGCYHPFMLSIVDEARSPSTSFSATTSPALLRGLLRFALLANCPTLLLAGESDDGSLSLSRPGIVTGGIGLVVTTPVVLQHSFPVDADDLRRLLESIDSLPDDTLLTIEVSAESLMLLALDGDQPFCDGLNAVHPTS